MGREATGNRAIYKVTKEEGAFQFGGRAWKRPVCWNTNINKISDDMQDTHDSTIQEHVKRGLLKHMVKAERINDAYGRYASYVVEDNQWE